MEMSKTKIGGIDWTKVTNKEEIIKLLKQREELETKIRAIDEKALVNYELEMLQLDEPTKINNLEPWNL